MCKGESAFESFHLLDDLETKKVKVILIIIYFNLKMFNKKYHPFGWYYCGHLDEGVKQNNSVNCFVARESLRDESESTGRCLNPS